MPDPYGFNHLGDDVRCIDCPTGGPIWQWPEHKRARHGRTHGISAKPVATDLRRQRILLAAPPTHHNEEKEATTMATTTPKSGKGEPAKQVAIDVLRKAGEPLHANEVAKRILASGRCAGLKGKTPEATISAMLAVGSKPGGPFTRVDKGTYTLADTATAGTATPAVAKLASAKPTGAKTTSAKPTSDSKSAAAKKPAARARTKRSTAKRSR
jgi:hypothetical protein